MLETARAKESAPSRFRKMSAGFAFGRSQVGLWCINGVAVLSPSTLGCLDPKHSVGFVSLPCVGVWY